MSADGVVFDLVAAQSPSYRGRGIDRYSTQLIVAMAGFHPELIASVVVHPALGEVDVPEELRPWATSAPDWDKARVLHLGSVVEPEVQVDEFWPREAVKAGLLTAVTLYDLIPDVFPGWYLVDPGLRRRWRCCRESVRVADAVLTLSESASEDAIALLGVPAERVHMIGGAPFPSFHPPASRAEAFAVAQSGVEGLEEGFILYTGAFNPRKNVDGLIKGYASLPPHLIERHQLVIVCEAPALTRNHYLVMARELGLGKSVLIPGFVPQEVLVALNQTASLSVFPSLYEGYGLPVLESLACGTPAIAGNNSSLRELLPRDALFEPDDPWAIAEAIQRSLTEPLVRQHLLDLTRTPAPTWEEVADKAADVFEGLFRKATRRPARWRRRAHVAVIGGPEGLADELQATGQVTADQFGWPGPHPAAMRRLDRWAGGYDIVAFVADKLGPDDIGPMSERAQALGRTCFVLFPPGAGHVRAAGSDEPGVPDEPGADSEIAEYLTARQADGAGLAELVTGLLRLAERGT